MTVARELAPLARRAFMSRALSCAAVLGAPGLLTACGGSGSDGEDPSDSPVGALNEQTVSVPLQFPPGTAASPPGSLRAWTSGSNSPTADGSATVTIYNAGPQYAEVRNAASELVLAAFIGPGRRLLDAGSTAEVLAYFSLGGFVLSANAGAVALASIRSVGGFAAVKAIVEAQLVKSLRLDLADPTLVAALTTFVSNAATGPTSTRAASLGREQPMGTIVTPVTLASGVAIDTGVDEELRITNTYLRRGIAWLDPHAHILSTGSRIPADRALAMKEPVALAMPKRYAGFVGTLSDLLQSKYPYTPESVGPLPIPAVYPGVSDCEMTTYKLTVVGPGLFEGDFGTLQGDRLNRAKVELVKAFVLDYVVPFVATVVVPLNGSEIDDFVKFAGGNAIVTDVINTLFTTAPNLWTLCAEGRSGEAFRSLRETGLLLNSVLPAMTQVFINWVENRAPERVAKNAAAYASDARYIFGTIGAIDLAVTQGELILVGSDIAQSNRADVFEVTSTGGKVSLVAARAALPSNETTSVRAVIQDRNPEAVFKYEWQVSEGFRLNDAFGSSTAGAPGGVLATSQDAVAILAENLEPGTATIRCKVTRIDGATDRPVASAEGTVVFTSAPTLRAAASQIDPGGSTVLTADYAGDGEVQWQYTLAPANAGALSIAGRTPSTTVTFQAGSLETSATISAEGFLRVGTEFVSIGTATASVAVGNVPLVVEASEFTWFFGFGMPEKQYNGYATRVVQVAPQTGAKRYEVYRNGSLLNAWSPAQPPVPIGTTARLLWADLKPADVYWVQSHLLGGGGSTVLTEAEAIAQAQSALNLIRTNYPNEVFTLKVLF